MSSPTTPAGGSEKTVRFGRLHVKTHGIILGDNPAVTYGPPISMAWEPFLLEKSDDGTSEKMNTISTRDEDIYTLDEYESIRPRRKADYYNPRRHLGPWVLLVRSQVNREQLLERLGVAPEEIQQALREVNRVKRSRWISQKWYFHPLRTVGEVPSNLVRMVRMYRINRYRRRVIRENIPSSSVRHSKIKRRRSSKHNKTKYSP